MKYLKLIVSFTFFGVIALSQNNEIKSYVAGEDPLLDASGSMADEYQYPILGRVIYVGYTVEM